MISSKHCPEILCWFSRACNTRLCASSLKHKRILVFLILRLRLPWKHLTSTCGAAVTISRTPVISSPMRSCSNQAGEVEDELADWGLSLLARRQWPETFCERHGCDRQPARYKRRPAENANKQHWFYV